MAKRNKLKKVDIYISKFELKHGQIGLTLK